MKDSSKGSLSKDSSSKGSFYSLAGDGIKVNLLIQPGSSKEGFAGLVDGKLKIRLAAPAVDGKANKALCQFLSNWLGVPKSSISIVHGLSARRKTVLIRAERGPVVKLLQASEQSG